VKTSIDFDQKAIRTEITSLNKGISIEKNRQNYYLLDKDIEKNH